MNQGIPGSCAAVRTSPHSLIPHLALAVVGLMLVLAWTHSAIAGQANALGYRWEALPEQPPIPADNPQTPERVLLGQQLFFDPRFSSTGTVSCNSCHNLMLGGDDGRSLSMGVHGLTGPRNAPTVWNAAFHSVQFWDGRAGTLEDQAQGPVVADVEMGMSSLEAAIARVREIPGYVEQFERVFGGDAPVTVDNAASAVAAYERTLITPNSPYDRYVKGENSALTEQQLRGMQTFAEWGCIACHRGSAFNGPKMPEPSYVNTCYSLISPDYGISVAMVYRLQDGQIVGVKGAGGLSPMDASARTREAEATYARSWFKNIISDIYG